MTTVARTIPVRDGFILPEDVSVYIGKKTLVKLILDAIEELKARGPECGPVATGSPACQPAMILTLLTYCYATGVYATTDIELGMDQDQMIRYLCAKNCVNLPVLRGYRRYNRDRIKECLAIVLQRVWELRFCDEDACSMAASSYQGDSFGWWANWIPAPDFTAEAEQRIARAVQADSMAMDW